MTTHADPGPTDGPDDPPATEPPTGDGPGTAAQPGMAAQTGERPAGRRLLARPPSDRYRSTDPATPDPEGSLTQAIAYGLVAAIVCCLILFGFAALASFSAGLVVVALFLGRIVGLSVRSGGGARVSAAARATAAIVLSLGAVTVALLATWAFARLTGGVLGLPEYLGETLGPIVPLAYMLATVGAWWGAD